MLETLIKNLDGLDEAVVRCLGARLILPALSLLFVGIDIVASLERQPGEGMKASFTRWVEQYLLPARPLGCTSIELYAARCGILHTFTAESDLSRTGKARKLYYAWGKEKIGTAPIFLTCFSLSIIIPTMTRISRVFAVGRPHHVTQRGNYRQTVFETD